MPYVEILAIAMLVTFFVMLVAGIPVGITLAISGLVFGYLGFGSLLFNLLPSRIFGAVTNSTLLAIPLFVFMGMMLERSKLAEELMDVIGHMAGALRGGFGIGIILVGVTGVGVILLIVTGVILVGVILVGVVLVGVVLVGVRHVRLKQGTQGGEKFLGSRPQVTEIQAREIHRLSA